MWKVTWKKLCWEKDIFIACLSLAAKETKECALDHIYSYKAPFIHRFWSFLLASTETARPGQNFRPRNHLRQPRTVPAPWHQQPEDPGVDSRMEDRNLKTGISNLKSYLPGSPPGSLQQFGCVQMSSVAGHPGTYCLYCFCLVGWCFFALFWLFFCINPESACLPLVPS